MLVIHLAKYEYNIYAKVIISHYDLAAIEDQQHQNLPEDSTVEMAPSSGLSKNLMNDDDLKSPYVKDVCLFLSSNFVFFAYAFYYMTRDFCQVYLNYGRVQIIHISAACACHSYFYKCSRHANIVMKFLWNGCLGLMYCLQTVSCTDSDSES